MSTEITVVEFDYTSVLGLECECYAGEAGTRPSGEGALVDIVRTVEVGLSSSQADVTIRKCKWRLKRKALKEGQIVVTVLYVPGNAHYMRFMESYLDDKAIALFPSDGQGNGFDADVEVMEAQEAQELEDVIVSKFTCMPALTSRGPTWTFASTSTP